MTFFEGYGLKTTHKLKSRVVLVTGAARRIGASIVQYFHQTGYDVVIHCHQALKHAEILAESCNQQRPNSAHVISCDLAQPNERIHLINQCGPNLSILINNASVFSKTDWDTLFNINVRAPYELSLLAAKILKHNRGAIINITDTNADSALKEYPIYIQTKAALNAQTRVLAKELAPDIRVNAIAPGAIAWPEGNNQLTPQQKQHVIEKTLLKQHGDPQYIAQMVHAVAENMFITGQVIRVDGGRY